jgi:hypothetical protein
MVAALKEARRVYTDPLVVETDAHSRRRTKYELLRSYYTNEAFEDLIKWQAYRSSHRLYTHTRMIYNPVKRLVDFYVNHVYPGVLSEDGSRLPAGIQLAIPLADDTDPELKAAIAQYWQWGNWQAGCGLMVQYGGITGNVLVENIDDLDRGKVIPNVVWAGHVAELELDETDNVKFYATEYDSIDEKGQQYTYRKEVDSDSYKTYRDDKPQGFDGKDAEYENPYGFVPAVWAKHMNQGGDFGIPAVGGSTAKIDELNSLASHVNDQIHKVIHGTMLIATDGDIVPLFSPPVKNDKRGLLSSADLSTYTTDRQSAPLFKAPPNTTAVPLINNLDLASALEHANALMSEIERDFPEITFYEKLREMTQVTGPAADRLMGDVKQKVLRVAANYDLQSTKLFQMAAAVSGWRLNRGDWGDKPSKQQMKFAPFDLTSYQKGQLDFSIMPRPLISLNESEMIGIDKARADAVKVKSEFIDEIQILSELGYNEDKIKEIQKRRREIDVIPSEAQ